MPLSVSLSVFPLRMLALAAVSLPFFYYRCAGALLGKIPLVYAAAYWINGASLAPI